MGSRIVGESRSIHPPRLSCGSVLLESSLILNGHDRDSNIMLCLKEVRSRILGLLHYYSRPPTPRSDIGLLLSLWSGEMPLSAEKVSQLK